MSSVGRQLTIAFGGGGLLHVSTVYLGTSQDLSGVEATSPLDSSQQGSSSAELVEVPVHVRVIPPLHNELHQQIARIITGVRQSFPDSSPNSGDGVVPTSQR